MDKLPYELVEKILRQVVQMPKPIYLRMKFNEKGRYTFSWPDSRYRKGALYCKGPHPQDESYCALPHKGDYEEDRDWYRLELRRIWRCVTETCGRFRIIGKPLFFQHNQLVVTERDWGRTGGKYNFTKEDDQLAKRSIRFFIIQGRCFHREKISKISNSIVRDLPGLLYCIFVELRYSYSFPDADDEGPNFHVRGIPVYVIRDARGTGEFMEDALANRPLSRNPAARHLRLLLSSPTAMAT